MNLANMRKIWVQDDAIPRSHEDYESVWDAYRRLTGSSGSYGDPVEVIDCGDETRYLMPDGYVVVSSGAGNSRVYAP